MGEAIMATQWKYLQLYRRFVTHINPEDAFCF